MSEETWVVAIAVGLPTVDSAVPPRALPAARTKTTKTGAKRGTKTALRAATLPLSFITTRGYIGCGGCRNPR